FRATNSRWLRSNRARVVTERDRREHVLTGLPLRGVAPARVSPPTPADPRRPLPPTAGVVPGVMSGPRDGRLSRPARRDGRRAILCPRTCTGRTARGGGV